MNIYKITNLLNGKIYIGQEKRDNPKYFGSGNLIKEAIKNEGIENFRKDIIEICNSVKDLNEREIFWIKELKSQSKEIGYNIAPGGSLFVMNEEIAKKVSDTLKGKYVGKKAFRHGLKLSDEHKRAISLKNKGLRLSEVTRRKLSQSHKGKKVTDLTKEKLSLSHRGKRLTENHKSKIGIGLLGNKHSVETKEKIKKSNINKKQKHSVSLDAININTKEILYFNNISQASRLLGCTRFRIKNNLVIGWKIILNNM